MKSNRSGTNGAASVEVAFVEDVVAVRDSKERTGPALPFTAAEWDAHLFLSDVEGGEIA